jgi:enoyl-CoA hydratase/carnithine racemase
MLGGLLPILWLARFVGDRLARQAIMYGRRFDCESAEGRLICDEVVPAEAMDRALADVIERMINSGSVSAVANRRSFRIAQEPLDLFRQYLALYTREQASMPRLISVLPRKPRTFRANNREPARSNNPATATSVIAKTHDSMSVLLS